MYLFCVVLYIMSQSDNSIFLILICSLFCITAVGFGLCLVHLFYYSLSSIKIVYNFFGKVVKIEKKLSFFIKN